MFSFCFHNFLEQVKKVKIDLVARKARFGNESATFRSCKRSEMIVMQGIPVFKPSNSKAIYEAYTLSIAAAVSVAVFLPFT